MLIKVHIGKIIILYNIFAHIPFSFSAADVQCTFFRSSSSSRAYYNRCENNNNNYLFFNQKNNNKLSRSRAAAVKFRVQEEKNDVPVFYIALRRYCGTINNNWYPQQNTISNRTTMCTNYLGKRIEEKKKAANTERQQKKQKKQIKTTKIKKLNEFAHSSCGNIPSWGQGSLSTLFSFKVTILHWMHHYMYTKHAQLLTLSHWMC